MKIILRGRQAGKTSALIQMMAENPSTVMVCHSRMEADRCYFEAQRLLPAIDWEPGRFCFVDDLVYWRGRSGFGATLLIDNLDLVIQRMFRNPVEAVTVTDDSLTSHNQQPKEEP